MIEKSIEDLEEEIARMEAGLRITTLISSDHCHHIRQSITGNSTCAIDKRRPAWTTQEDECIDIESGCPKYVKS